MGCKVTKFLFAKVLPYGSKYTFSGNAIRISKSYMHGTQQKKMLKVESMIVAPTVCLKPSIVLWLLWFKAGN